MTTHRFVRLGGVAVAVAVASAAAVSENQQTPPPQQPAAVMGTIRTDDPRAGLKPGKTDAGVAAWNLELVASLPKPPGFDDPDGTGGLNFANSDLAFEGQHLFLGTFNGFNIYDVEDPRQPKLWTSMPCCIREDG